MFRLLLSLRQQRTILDLLRNKLLLLNIPNRIYMKKFERFKSPNVQFNIFILLQIYLSSLILNPALDYGRKKEAMMILIGHVIKESQIQQAQVQVITSDMLC